MICKDSGLTKLKKHQISHIHRPKDNYISSPQTKRFQVVVKLFFTKECTYIPEYTQLKDQLKQDNN